MIANAPCKGSNTGMCTERQEDTTKIGGSYIVGGDSMEIPHLSPCVRCIWFCIAELEPLATSLINPAPRGHIDPDRRKLVEQSMAYTHKHTHTHF